MVNQVIISFGDRDEIIRKRARFEIGSAGVLLVYDEDNPHNHPIMAFAAGCWRRVRMEAER